MKKLATILLTASLIGCGDSSDQDIPFSEITFTINTNSQGFGAPAEGMARAACVIVDATGLYVVVDENPTIEDPMQLPGGQLDGEESPLQAVAREVWEETGLRIHSATYLFTTERTNNFRCEAEGTAETQKPDAIVHHHETLGGLNWK